MKFTGYLPLYEDANTFDFGPDRSIRLVGHALKVEHNDFDCSNCVCEWDGNFQRCYRYVLFKNLVLLFPKWN